MGFRLERVHVWTGEIRDQAGGAASKLAMLSEAGANFEFVFTRRQADKPGTGVMFVAPITGPSQVRAAKAAGLSETHEPIVMRVTGDNEAGLAHRLTHDWAAASISLQGLSMAVLGGKFVGYIAFDTVADANRAAQVLADISTSGS